MAEKEKTFKSVLESPRITEKAVLSSESKGVYAFNVTPEATKKGVIASIKNKYKVTPVKVRLLAVPSRAVSRAGKWGVRSGGKKAYVYLKKGDKIEFA
jgi:large subunit ribosomal protein L23